jgi:hypothetical protein
VRPRHLNTLHILKQVPDQRPSTTGLQETSFQTNLHKVFTCCCSPCPTKSFSSSIYSFKPHFPLFFSAAITIFKIIAVYQTPYSSGRNLNLNMHSAFPIVLAAVGPTLARPPFPHRCGRHRGEENVGGDRSKVNDPIWERPTGVLPTATKWGHGIPASGVAQSGLNNYPVATSIQAADSTASSLPNFTPVESSSPQITGSSESVSRVGSSSTVQAVIPSAAEVNGYARPKSTGRTQFTASSSSKSKASSASTPRPIIVSTSKPSSSSTSYPNGSSGSLSGGTPGPGDYVLIANAWRQLLKLPAFEYNANLEAAAQNTQNKADGQYHLALGPEPGEVTFSSSGMLLGQPTASDVNDAFRTWICEMPELLTAAGVDYINAQTNLGKYGTMLAGCGKNSPAHSTAPSDSLALLHAQICGGKSTAIGCA